MLADIKDYLTDYARVIATVTGIDVEVVDVGFVRLAGTGMYQAGVGRSVLEESEIYRHAMRIRQTVLLENPREHPLCRRCRKKAQCRETLTLCTPILDNEEVAGVIGLVCFTDQERERVLAQRDTYLAFVAQMAEVTGQRLRDHRHTAKAKEFLDLMLDIVDQDNRGVLVFNAKGGVSYANALARRELGLGPEDPLVGIAVRHTGDAISDMDAFQVSRAGSKTMLAGRMTSLGSRDPHFARVLTFESLGSVTQRVVSLAGAVKSSGLDAILGSSKAIRDLKDQIRKVARSTSTVLITGESGTGKELAARAIHQVSDRRDQPFIAINCGAIPDTLLESELFGYAAGAFTGANAKGKMGKFELADRGVVFLDEISALPLYLQVKLLRVLQERQFCRLGSNRVQEVDIRVIAATNDDLPALMRQGRFREDLYYRLNVIPLRTPPLRHRPEDIPVLAEHFLRKYAARFGKPTPQVDSSLLTALSAHPWPGNVREFENAVEFLVNMAPETGPIHEGLLPPDLRRSPEARLAGWPETDPTALILPLAELERAALTAALARFGPGLKGKRAAAKALGLGLATLYRKAKLYGLEHPPDRPDESPGNQTSSVRMKPMSS